MRWTLVTRTSSQRDHSSATSEARERSAWDGESPAGVGGER